MCLIKNFLPEIVASCSLYNNQTVDFSKFIGNLESDTFQHVKH